MAPPVPSRRQRYLTVIVRALLTAVLAFLFAEVAGRYLTDHLLPTSYTATSEIRIGPRPADKNGVENVPVDEVTYREDTKILISSNLLLPIIQDLGFDKAWANRLAGEDDAKALSSEEAIEHLRKMLKLERIPHTNIVKISVTSDEPKETATIANAIANRYKTMRDIEEEQRSERSLDELKNQIAQQQKEVAEKKAPVEKLRQDLGARGIVIPATDGDSSNANAPLKSFRDAQRELAKSQSLLDALSVRLEQDKKDQSLEAPPVRIVSRAQPPTHAHHHVAHIVTNLFAVIVAITAASFVEIIMLFRRAGERE